MLRLSYLTTKGSLASIRLPRDFVKFIRIESERRVLIKNLPERGYVTVDLDFYSENPKRVLVSRNKCVEIIKSLLAENRKIAAIKILREFDASFYLKDAKRFVDKIEIRERNRKSRQKVNQENK